MSYAPILTEQQIERIRHFAEPRSIEAGQILYEPGFDTPPVYVVLSGEIRILAIGGGQESTITSYKAAQFSGELLMIAGRKSIYRCQAIESGTVLELQAQDLRALIAKDAELSDIFMNAFLARRLSLKTAGHGNVVVLGSRYSADTLAVREFLIHDAGLWQLMSSGITLKSPRRWSKCRSLANGSRSELGTSFHSWKGRLLITCVDPRSKHWLSSSMSTSASLPKRGTKPSSSTASGS